MIKKKLRDQRIRTQNGESNGSCTPYSQLPPPHTSPLEASVTQTPQLQLWLKSMESRCSATLAPGLSRRIQMTRSLVLGVDEVCIKGSRSVMCQSLSWLGLAGQARGVSGIGMRFVLRICAGHSPPPPSSSARFTPPRGHQSSPTARQGCT